MRMLPASKTNKRAAICLLIAKMIKRVDVSCFQKKTPLSGVYQKTIRPHHHKSFKTSHGQEVTETNVPDDACGIVQFIRGN